MILTLSAAFSIAMYTLSSHSHGYRDFLAFHLELARELVGGFCSRQHTSHPLSVNHECLGRLNVGLGPWVPKVVKSRRCVVCLAVGRRLGCSNALKLVLNAGTAKHLSVTVD